MDGPDVTNQAYATYGGYFQLIPLITGSAVVNIPALAIVHTSSLLP